MTAEKQTLLTDTDKDYGTVPTNINIPKSHSSLWQFRFDNTDCFKLALFSISTITLVAMAFGIFCLAISISKGTSLQDEAAKALNCTKLGSLQPTSSCDNICNLINSYCCCYGSLEKNEDILNTALAADKSHLRKIIQGMAGKFFGWGALAAVGTTLLLMMCFSTSKSSEENLEPTNGQGNLPKP